MTPLYEAIMKKKHQKERIKEFIENAIVQMIGAIVISAFGYTLFHLVEIAFMLLNLT